MTPFVNLLGNIYIIAAKYEEAVQYKVSKVAAIEREIDNCRMEIRYLI
jgi:hypothetical protein